MCTKNQIIMAVNKIKIEIQAGLTILFYSCLCSIILISNSFFCDNNNNNNNDNHEDFCVGLSKKKCVELTGG